MIKLHPSWFMFFMLVMMGLTLVMSSDNWFMTWMGFELSLLGFMPMFSGNTLVIEGMLKYFLVQAGASAMFLFSYFLGGTYLSSMTFILSMCMKVGIFPFFQWVPVVMTSLSWTGCLILSTIQKVAPLFMIMQAPTLTTNTVILLGAASIMMSGLMGYNQSMLRPLMGYSSISHSGWTICSAVFNTKLTLLYFMMYSYVNLVLFTHFEKNMMMGVAKGQTPTKQLIWMNLMLLTLAGLPPFSMFFLKAMVLMSISNFTVVAYLMLMGAALSVFYYLSFIIPSFSTYWNSNKKETNISWAAVIAAFMMPLAMVI